MQTTLLERGKVQKAAISLELGICRYQYRHTPNQGLTIMTTRPPRRNPGTGSAESAPADPIMILMEPTLGPRRHLGGFHRDASGTAVYFGPSVKSVDGLNQVYISYMADDPFAAQHRLRQVFPAGYSDLQRQIRDSLVHFPISVVPFQETGSAQFAATTSEIALGTMEISQSEPQAPSDHGGDRSDRFDKLLDDAAAGLLTWPEPPVEETGIRILGADLIGRDTESEGAIARAVERGIPASAVNRLLEAGYLRAEVERLVIPWRTLQRRQKDGLLSPQESDAALRLARVLEKAEDTLGSRSTALNWLRTPKQRFGERAPLDLLSTDSGARWIESVLRRADYGQTA
jgi:putative toxin-antitoxin system antitoxin component (TIGR02293 family)